MSTSRCVPGRWGLTGPHPNLLTDLRLYKPCGTPVSLHRYAGRWVIVRLTDAHPDTDESIEGPPTADFVRLNVVAGPISPTEFGVPVMFDASHGFSQRFPALDLPATFVIDPDGRLVAILDDLGWPDLVKDLVRKTGRPAAHGAIDQQDITR